MRNHLENIEHIVAVDIIIIGASAVINPLPQNQDIRILCDKSCKQDCIGNIHGTVQIDVAAQFRYRSSRDCRGGRRFRFCYIRRGR